MYVRELLASCHRRWPLLLAVLVLVGGLCWTASAVVRPTYASEASLVLVPPRNAESPDLNRMLDLSSLSDSVDVLARSMRSAETLEALEDVGPGTGFEVLPDYTTSAPILQVTVTGPDRASTDAMLEAVLTRVPENLAQLQKRLGIKKPHLITTVPVALDERALPDQKARLRVLAVLAAALLCAGVVLVGAIDGLLLRRRSRGDGDGDAADVEADSGVPRRWVGRARPASPWSLSLIPAAVADEADDPDRATAEDQEPDELGAARAAVDDRHGDRRRAQAR